MDALKLLHPECWSLVFQHLNADDLLSCRQVCRSFHQLLDLQEFQRKWKFQLVLPLLFDHLESRNENSWENLHKIRLICRSWRHSLDKYVSKFQEPSFFSEQSRHLPLATTFLSSEEVRMFHQTLRDCSGNPFPAKTVFICNEEENIGEEHEENREHAEVEDAAIRIQDTYIQNISDFMERFGRHILKLDLDLSRQHFRMDSVFMCKLIQRITTHLPNLITFRISTYDYTGQRDDQQRMATWMEENALSDLPKLVALQIAGLNETATNYLMEKYAPQLSLLQKNVDSNSREDLQNQLTSTSQRFENLTKLWLETVDGADTLEPLRSLKSPLKILRLCLCCYQTEPLTWNVDKALRNLQHLPIEYLNIEIYPHVHVAEAGLSLEEYTNESIQTLSIHVDYFDKGKISFNFLQALSKLENLKLEFEAVEGAEITHPEDLPEVVKLDEYLMSPNEYVLREDWTNLAAIFQSPGLDRRGFYHSNLWEKVPSLKTLKANWFSEVAHVNVYCTRETYEEVRRIAEQ